MIGKNISSIGLLLITLAMLVNVGESFIAFAPKRQLTSLNAESANDPAEIVGRRILVKGDVNGGYVRTCIQNEVRTVAVNFSVLHSSHTPYFH